MRLLVAEVHPVVALEAYNSTSLLGMCDPAGALEAYSLTNLLEMCAQLDAMAEDAFDRLMTEQPSAAALIEPSAGYAVFDARKVSLIGLTGGAGRGVAEDAQTRIRSYMKTQLSTKQSASDFMVLKTV